MSQHQHTPGQSSIADPNALLAVSRRAGRTFALYFVLLGLAALVAGFLLSVLSLKIAIPAALLVVGACVAALGIFANNHRHIARQFSHLARPFWLAYGFAVLLAILGVAFWAGHEWIGWVGGGLGLVDGLAAGHFIDRASQAATRSTADSAVH
ncbi:MULTISPECIES: hypothetical protein [unclassified Luteococcus]|uniref:hypothetical protein n=1 Tax=unclassified Luteococcus TaxID=2639923 RepID=UPI00313B8BFD